MSEDLTPQIDAGLGQEEKPEVAETDLETKVSEEKLPNWRETYLKDTDLFDNPSLATITDPLTLAKAFVETKALVGKKGIILPTEKDPPEKWDEFYKALGRPDTADGYEITKPEDLPKEFPYSDERVTSFKALAHKIGLTPAHVKELYNWQIAEGRKEFAAYQESVKAYSDTFVDVEGLGKVPKQWIEDHNKVVETFKVELGDKYDTMMKKATIAAMKFGGQDLKDFVDKTGFGDNPAVVRAWIKVAEATLTEDEWVASQEGTMSRKDRIAAINRDPALLDTTNLTRQRELVAQRNLLIDEEYADKSA